MHEAERGSFAICPVCYWEDDDIQFDDPTRSGGANRVSLDQARKNFSAFGACDESARDHVRPPERRSAPDAKRAVVVVTEHRGRAACEAARRSAVGAHASDAAARASGAVSAKGAAHVVISGRGAHLLRHLERALCATHRSRAPQARVREDAYRAARVARGNAAVRGRRTEGTRGCSFESCWLGWLSTR